MDRKITVMLVAGMLVLCLSGCSSEPSFTETAQDRVNTLASFASADLTTAISLAATDSLNYPAAAQCLPVLTKWLSTLKARADRYREVKGAASAVIYKHWAEQTVKQGVPPNVILACSAMWVTEQNDFADALGAIQTLLGK